MSNKTEDIIMKNIMELFKGDAVKFFGIDKKIVSAARTELTHIQVQKNTGDWFMLADDDSFVHFEFQTTYNKEDLARFMVSDAMLYFKEHKPIKTVVVYSAEIEDTITELDIGALQYSVDAFYMVRLDGDKTYEELEKKVVGGIPLTKQDLMSVVFLPLMKSRSDKVTKIERAIKLSNGLKDADEQMQIQAMLQMLADKFITDKETLKRLKGMMKMSIIAEMIANDKAVEIANNMIKDGVGISVIAKYTGLSEEVIKELQVEFNTR